MTDTEAPLTAVEIATMLVRMAEAHARIVNIAARLEVGMIELRQLQQAGVVDG
jgi:hypothetical protein